MVDTYFERLLVRPDLGYADHHHPTMGMGRVLALPIDFGRHAAAKPFKVSMVQREQQPPRSGDKDAPNQWQPMPPLQHMVSITQYTLRDPAD